MGKVPFKVSARTAKLIGLENFSNEEGAIIELVKNTYDADAANCILIFDLKNKGRNDDGEDKVSVADKQLSKIYIIDNGSGMTRDIISNQWMTIGTDDKLYKHTTDRSRVKTGAKGIGRFALNRLGVLTELFTVSKTDTTKGVEWLVDWRDFDRQGATVSDVEAVLTDIEGINLKERLLTTFNTYPVLIDKINGISFDSGTVIEISELNDDWEFSQLERLFGNLEMLLPPAEQPDFRIDFFCTSDIDKFGQVGRAYYNDYDYKIEATYKGHQAGEEDLEIKITRNELDVSALESRYAEIFDYPAMQTFPYRLEDFKANSIVLRRSLQAIMPRNTNSHLIEQVGKFSFIFYFLKNTLSDDKADRDVEKKYPYKDFESAHRKAWLKKFGGIKIFRDDFRIRPYGENGDDWLKLGERQARSPGGAGQRLGGYKIGPNQVAGTVKISRIYNLQLQDKSGREGIIENDVFELFKNIIREIIAFFEKDRNTIMYHLSELHEKRNEEAERLRKAEEAAAAIKKEQEKASNDTTSPPPTNAGHSPSGQVVDPQNEGSVNISDRERILADGVTILREQSDKKDEEIRLLRSLASVGLIISSFAHEVKSLQSRLIPRTNHLLSTLRNYLDESKLSQVDKDDNPFYMIGLMQSEDIKLKHWLDYSLNTLKRDKRERTNLHFGDYFERFKSTWSKALEQRNIEIILKGSKDDDCIIRAFEVDMDSIFNNLLSNSMNALKGNLGRPKQITISWKKIADRIEIIFADNGIGLDTKYRNEPERIFNLNETSKSDSKGNVIGTGLGLYIVKTIIKEHNHSDISIGGYLDGLQLKIIFKSRE